MKQTLIMRKRYFPPFLLLAVLFVVIAFCAAHSGKQEAVLSFAESKKEIYLTFDDGPSTVVTNRILDTLRDEGVKATFFIVSDRAQTRRETLKRIVREGHTIGVHSASHDYSKIYASNEALLKDVNECAQFIRSVTGITPTVYRFPGGGLSEKERKAVLLERAGYQVIGWNAVCGDEEIPYADAHTLLTQSIRTSKGKNPVVLLLHDSATHKETAAALPAIIGYFRAQGYEFCAF